MLFLTCSTDDCAASTASTAQKSGVLPQNNTHTVWCNIPRFQLPGLLEAAKSAKGGTTLQTLAKLAATLLKSAKAKAIDKLTQATGLTADALVTVIATSGGAILLGCATWLVWYMKKQHALRFTALQAVFGNEVSNLSFYRAYS